MFTVFEKLIFLSVACFAHGSYLGPTTNAGVNLIMDFEGFRPHFYIDPAGIRRIGHGHACHVGNRCAGIRAPISRQFARTLLLNDLRPYENCVKRIVRFPGLNAAQFSSLVSFTFNLGCASLNGSTLLQLLNQGRTRGASFEFGKWTRSGSRILPGLVRRREAERRLFCSRGGC